MTNDSLSLKPKARHFVAFRILLLELTVLEQLLVAPITTDVILCRIVEFLSPHWDSKFAQCVRTRHEQSSKSRVQIFRDRGVCFDRDESTQRLGFLSGLSGFLYRMYTLLYERFHSETLITCRANTVKGVSSSLSLTFATPLCIFECYGRCQHIVATGSNH